MMRTQAALFGAVAAFAAPWHLDGARLKHLLDDPSRSVSDESRNDNRVAAGTAAALRSANLMLRVLARIPAAPWRNTCLYRSVAGCLALRWLGEGATLRIGARRDGNNGEVQAHAWIEGFTDDDQHCDAFHVLTRRTRAKS